MKIRLFGLFGSSLIVCALATGCAHDIRRATVQRSVDLASGQSPAGVVEFYSVSNNAVVPIYQLDPDGSPKLMSAVGLAPGNRYDFNRYHTVVAKRLTVTAPAGTQQFLIDGEGPLVKVPVAEGKTTPVEIRYQLLEQGDGFALYTADANVSAPAERSGDSK